MASVPRTAARRPGRPPATASPAAMASQSRELLAASGRHGGVDRPVHRPQLAQPFGNLLAGWPA